MLLLVAVIKGALYRIYQDLFWETKYTTFVNLCYECIITLKNVA